MRLKKRHRDQKTSRHRDQVDNFNLPPFLIGDKIIQMVLSLNLLLFPMTNKTWIENYFARVKTYSLEFVSKYPPFLFRPSDTKIQTTVICW